MLNRLIRILPAAAVACSLAGCATSAPAPGKLLKPRLLFNLPEMYNSPDGMTVGKDGNIYLSMNNKGNQDYPGLIMRISDDDKIKPFCMLPVHPKTGKVSPLGIVFGGDGNLYVADNQAFVTTEAGQSRLLRVNLKHGKPVGTVDVVAEGFTMANGIAAHGDQIFVNDTCMADTAGQPLKSGTYRFRLGELKAGAPVKVTGWDDPHVVLKVTTKAGGTGRVGANGVACDGQGALYVCNFGDREIIKATFTPKGDVAAVTTLAQGGGLESVDGLQFCHGDGLLYVADFLGNAVAAISPQTGAITILAKNAPGDGADGSLDAPSECLRRGNKLYISNIDITYGPNSHDNVHTMSVLDL
jgi:sugar lactone lactonase YvrE